MFTEAIENKIFQGKKPCEIKFTTDSKTNIIYSPTQRIQYTAFPSVLSFTIFYKGSSYIFNCPSTEVKAKAESYLQLNLDYIISVFTTSILFSKRSQYKEGFTIETTDSCTLVNSTATKLNVLDISYPINLIVQDTTPSIPNTLIEMKKAVPSSGIAIFDISAVIKANVYQEAFVRSVFAISPTNLFREFKIYAETLSGVDAFYQASIFGMKTNLNDDELTYLSNGNPLMINNAFRFVADDSNEKIYYYKKSDTDIEKIKITAYSYNRRKSETYTFNITTLAKNTIYEIPTNWNSIKDLFSTIDAEDIVEYSVSLDVNVVIKWTVNYRRKEFIRKKEFLYINKFSAWDNIIFEGKNESNVTIDQDSVESRQKLIQVSKKVFEKQKQNTGFITSEEHREHIKDFLLSEKVYEVISGALVEVIVTADNYLLKQLDSSELLNIQFEYSYSNFKQII